eukprot:gene772-10502_t
MSQLKSLAVVDRLEVDTSHGECEIQLCFGSVTKLEKKEKVDVLMVSAFPDIYAPNPASVIGALYTDLGISVEDLAKDKEEDLRRLLSCWWSKPLPDDCSFGRILCFEGCFKRQVRSPVIVKDAFKALVSICKNNDIKVMTPLLTSSNKEHPINYDVYLSYSPKDQDVADLVQQKLLQNHSSIKIFSQQQHVNEDVSWQDEVYDVMAACARVIALLTRNYVTDSNCLEQYNIALCCTRSMERDYLAPFYVDTIDNLPTYMSLIQYIDCSPSDDAKISMACMAVINWLQTHKFEIQHLVSETQSALTIGSTNDCPNYDIFISYSHANTDAAQRIKDQLLSLHPTWNIFIDVAELKSGTAWQAKLYKSIESSRTVIVLISQTYVKSKVCQEEYNLASAMHSDFSYNTKLLPLLVETVADLPSWCREHTPIDCRDISDRSLAQLIKRVDAFRQYGQLDKPKVTSIEDVTSNWRTYHYQSGLKYLKGLEFQDMIDFKTTQILPGSGSNSIALSYHSAENDLAQFLSDRLRYFLPNVKISHPEPAKVRSSVLDEASIIVPLLSHAYTKSAELSEELNIALCRQRSCSSWLFFPIYTEKLPSKPAYFRLLLSLFSCTDELWESNASDAGWSTKQKCLDAAARLISYVLVNGSNFTGSFKTLLSTEEISECTLQLRAKIKIDATSGNNPFYF